MLQQLENKSFQHPEPSNRESDDDRSASERKFRGWALLSPDQLPKLPESMALIYLALMILRSPVTVRDVSDWIVDEEFPYLSLSEAIPGRLLARLPQNLRGVFQSKV